MAYSPSSINNFDFNPADPAGIGIPQTNQTNEIPSSAIKESLNRWAANKQARAQMQGAKAQEAQWSSGGQLGGPNAQSGLGGATISGGLADYSNLPAPISHDCPHCGRCPNCGRGGYGYVPYYPPPIPYYGPAYYVGDTPNTWYGPTSGTINTAQNQY